MPPGGARPGAGKPPTRLTVPIDFDFDGKPVTIIERVEQALRAGAFLHDAAARIGYPVETLRGWRKVGQRTIREVVQGKRRNDELTEHERECAQLAARMERAESDAKLMLLGHLGRLAHGNVERVETKVKVGPNGVAETTTTTMRGGPDGRALTWLLERRWPDDYGRSRLELTGPEGGPIVVEAQSAADRLRTLIADVRRSKAETEPDAMAAHSTGNGASPNGHEPPSANGANGHHA